jgi:hypothetical protein
MSQRGKWIKFFVIPLAISIAAIVGIVAWANSGDPRSEARRGDTDDFIHMLLPWMLLIGIVGVILAIIRFAIRLLRAVETREPDTSSISGPRGFAVVANASLGMTQDGPGQYRVEGVHKATKMDTAKYFQASSAANAKAKAELEDIVVTSVKKIPV